MVPCFFFSKHQFAIAIVYYYIDGLSQNLSSQVTVAKVLQDWTMPLKQKRIHQHVSCLDGEQKSMEDVTGCKDNWDRRTCIINHSERM